jgi:iron uptake system component EfeO
MSRFRVPLAGTAALSIAALAAFASPAAAKSATITIKLTDAGCPKKITAAPGPTTFQIKNVDASSVSEFEVLRRNHIVGEKENLTPGLSGQFSLTLKAGTYTTLCPGGDREKGKLIVRA